MNLFKQHIVSPLIILLLMLFIASCSLQSQKVVVDNITAKDMAQLSEKLYNIGIISNIEKNSDGTFAVKVMSSDYIVATQALLNLGIYHDDTQEKIMKIVSKGSMVETPMEQQFRFNQLVSQTLASTLSTIGHVVYANVYISNEINSNSTNNVDLAGDDKSTQMKASVYLKVSGLPPTQHAALINNVKKIVAGAVMGLSTDAIYVVIEEA